MIKAKYTYFCDNCGEEIAKPEWVITDALHKPDGKFHGEIQHHFCSEGCHKATVSKYAAAQQQKDEVAQARQRAEQRNRIKAVLELFLSEQGFFIVPQDPEQVAAIDDAIADLYDPWERSLV